MPDTPHEQQWLCWECNSESNSSNARDLFAEGSKKVKGVPAGNAGAWARARHKN